MKNARQLVQIAVILLFAKISVFLKRISTDRLEIFVLMFYLVLKCTVVFHLCAAVQQKSSDIGQCITLHYEDLEFSFKLEPFQKRLPSKSKRQN